MLKPESSAEIDDAAAAWVARADRAPLTPQEAEALQAWLAGDPRRLGAYAKAKAVFTHFDRAKALGAGYAPEQFGAPAIRRGPLRRNLLLGGAAALAAGIVAVVVGVPQSYSTRRGEVRRVPLPDGSVMTLNTESTAHVRYTDARRQVKLLQGEALFEVAKNPARPFTVEAAGVRVRAVGTTFSVRRRREQTVEVAVREGAVEVAHIGSLAQPPAILPANDTTIVVAGAPIRPIPLAPGQIAKGLAWRDGMIDFEGVSLNQAAAEFGRYSDPPILIDDPAVGQMTITGLFSAGNPVGFAKAAAVSLNLRAESDPEGVRLSR